MCEIQRLYNISAKLIQIVKAEFEARSGFPDWTVERMEC